MSWIDNPKFLSVRPYLKIMRLDNLTGVFLLLWPCLWSIGFASENNIPVITFLLFTMGAFLMRSAGCIINDIIDKKLDAQVERTRGRPLSSGSLKTYEAVLLTSLLLIISFITLMSMNNTTIMLGYIIIVPIFVYPFMKRITYWPQLFLAFTINWGALMGWSSLHDGISTIPVMIYVACVFWTLGYDTIYAHQDKDDDAMLGIKSTAIRLGVNTKKYLYLFYSITVILLWLVGIMSGSGILFHVFLIMGGMQLFWQVNTAKLDESSDCMAKFTSNKYFGIMIFLGVLLGKIHF